MLLRRPKASASRKCSPSAVWMSACEARIDSSSGSGWPDAVRTIAPTDVVAFRAAIGEGGAEAGGRALLRLPREAVEQRRALASGSSSAA